MLRFRMTGSLIALVAWSALSAAADVAIIGHGRDPDRDRNQPITVEPYTLVRLAVSGLDDKAGVRWRVRPVAHAGVADWATPTNVRAVIFVAPPGKYQVSVIYVQMADGGALMIDELDVDLVIRGDSPAPPTPPTPPTPPNPEPNPSPGPRPDPELVASYRQALTEDERAAPALGWKAENVRADAARLAAVFADAASLLDLRDPNIAPRTWADLQRQLMAASQAKRIAPIPYLKAVRTINATVVGEYRDSEVITDDMRRDFQTKFRRIAAALAEASR